MAPKGQKVKELTMTDRKAAMSMLLMSVKDGKPERGSFVRVAKVLGVKAGRIERLWPVILEKMKKFLLAQSAGNVARPMTEFPLIAYPDSAFEPKKAIVGRRETLDREWLKEQTRLIPLNQRSAHRSHAKRLGVSITSVFRLLKKEQTFVIHSSTLKPALTEEHKPNCLKHALSKIDVETREGKA